MATNCSLYRDMIPSAIKEFAENKGVEWCHTSEKDAQDTYKLIQGKTNTFITIYYKKNGLTSISHQGSKKTAKLGEECCAYVITKTSLPDTSLQTFTIRNAKVENYGYFKLEIGDENIVIVNANDKNISERIRVTDKTGATITVTMYKNATIYLQGVVTPLFVSLMNAGLQWMFAEDDANSSIISMKNVSCNFERDVAKHIEHIEKLKPDGNVMIKMMETSLQLANSGIVVSDYGCYTYGILKAIEGIIKQRLLEDVPSFNNFGDYFVLDKTTRTYKFKSTLYDGQLGLKRSLEKAYTHFNKYRHSTFHVDNQIVTTKILSYSEAISIIDDSLAVINDLCNHWT